MHVVIGQANKVSSQMSLHTAQEPHEAYASTFRHATMGVGGRHGAAESCPSADEPIIRSVYDQIFT